MAALAAAGPVPSVTGWTPRAARLGAYVHLPFCVERCGYCSFNTAPYTPGGLDRFLSALIRECDLAGTAPWAPGVTLDTVFLGGGTPSLLDASQMAQVLAHLGARLALEPSAEVTAECNPDDLGVERLTGYRRAGVSRISLGVQSLDDAVLARLDRRHSAGQARHAFAAAREAGFDNVSVDLIYGLPGLDLAAWTATVHEALAWEPDHLSAYALTLDEGSLWQATGVGGLPPEETVTAQYWTLARLAAEAGFEHYEVSNYARPGFRSRHNQRYWRWQEYLALGPGACGFLGRVRYGNVKPVERYCSLVEAGRLPLQSHEVLTERQALAEQLILGLRTSDGIPVERLAERCAMERDRLPETLDAWRERELLVEGDGRARLTEAGFLLSDSLFTELL